MKRVCLLVGMAALAAMDVMAELRTNDVNGVTMVYDVGNEGVRIKGASWEEPAISSGTVGAIVIPETIDGTRVVAIGDYAFSGCSGITSITLPNTITNIGAYAFSGCAIAEIDLPAGLRSLGGAAFLNCKKLKSVVVPGGVSILPPLSAITTTGTESSGGSSSTSSSSGSSTSSSFEGIADIPVTAVTAVLSLGGTISSSSASPSSDSSGTSDSGTASGTVDYSFTVGVFEGCASLSSVVIQDGVRTIGYRAFAKCLRLQELSLPASVVTIGEEAFYGCRSLQEVEFLGDEPNVGGWNLFKGTPTSLLVEVKNDAWWYDPITFERLQTWLGRAVTYEGVRYGADQATDDEGVKEKM